MKNSGIPLSSLPPKLQAQITAQLGPKTRHDVSLSERAVFDLTGQIPKPRLRQSSKGPNKTEAAFAAHLRAKYPTITIHEQAVTLMLANGVRFTPDMFAWDPDGRGPVAWETKGHMRDDAAVKIKVAAAVYPAITFFLVTRRGRTCGGWDIQRILP